MLLRVILTRGSVNDRQSRAGAELNSRAVPARGCDPPMLRVHALSPSRLRLTRVS